MSAAASASRPLRLILADDHQMLRDGLRRSLEDYGLDVVGEASDGEEAVRLAEQLRPDIVLMDVSMPRLDGIEATRAIGRRVPDTRVVVLTMHSDGDVRAEAVQAGAVGYLVKDCSTEEVVSVIRGAADIDGALSPELAGSMLSQATEPPRGGQSNGTGREPLISDREEEVLQLVADGLSLPDVAAQLYISVKTVKNHLSSIYAKLDAHDRTQAVLRAVRMGIIRLD